jgi:tetratricopeptide (TPR) repeat protein
MQAQAHKLSGWRLSRALYDVAFLRGEVGEMDRLVSKDPYLLMYEAETEAFHGRLTKAREFTRMWTDSEIQSGNRENAADIEAVAALWEAEFGNAQQAKKLAGGVVAHVSNREALVVAALALGRAGDSPRALATADKLNRQLSLDTLLNGYWLPAVRAAVEIGRGNPSRAVELLQPATVYDLNVEYTPGAPLCLVYVRGEAYLALRQGSQAATEFQKILSHPGIVVNCPLGALAHLGLARAYALHGDTAQARAAYQDFLTLWKDADPDIPILKQAKAEYAKLQ